MSTQNTEDAQIQEKFTTLLYVIYISFLRTKPVAQLDKFCQYSELIKTIITYYCSNKMILSLTIKICLLLTWRRWVTESEEIKILEVTSGAHAGGRGAHDNRVIPFSLDPRVGVFWMFWISHQNRWHFRRSVPFVAKIQG